VSVAIALTLRAGEELSRSSATYSIRSETIDAGGLNATSAHYSLRGSAVGEFASGNQIPVSSASYSLREDYVGQLSDLLMRATSRLAHNAAGVFDVNLPLSGGGVEPRNSSTYTVVLTFASPLVAVQSVSASATGAVQPGPSNGAIDPNDAHNYIATLTGLPNAQRITLSLGNVSDADSNSVATLPLTMGLLIGDANGDGSVNSGDAAVTRNNSGHVTDATNFRADYNLDGAINSGDASITRNRSGTAVPAGNTLSLPGKEIR
jgi:hypothetical protein